MFYIKCTNRSTQYTCIIAEPCPVKTCFSCFNHVLLRPLYWYTVMHVFSRQGLLDSIYVFMKTSLKIATIYFVNMLGTESFLCVFLYPTVKSNKQEALKV